MYATEEAVVGEPEVRGSAFLEPLRHLRERVGDDGLREVVRDSGPGVAQVFANPIRKLSYYRYADYIDFLCGIDRRLGKSDFAYGRLLGEEAGRRDLGTILKVFVALASAERLIRSSARVWSTYYKNAGRMAAEAWEPEHTVLRIYDFPEMHPVHCRMMEGWMIATMRTIGFEVSERSRETACTARGGPFHEFTATWTKLS